MKTLALQRSNARAELQVQGAQLTSWELNGEPVLYLSPRAVQAPGKALRGGIPICFPWFNAHRINPKLPSHGFARISEWQVRESGGDCLVLGLEDSEVTRDMWPHAFAATLRVQLLREGLLLDFRVTNTGELPFEFETALHTYFAVKDAAAVTIEGLEGKTYLDHVEGDARKVQQGGVTLSGETDRLYVNAPGPVVLQDGTRRIHLEGLEGWQSTIVWNPWREKAEAMPDLGGDQFPRFVCVESGFAADNAVTLPPGETQRLALEITVR